MSGGEIGLFYFGCLRCPRGARDFGCPRIWMSEACQLGWSEPIFGTQSTGGSVDFGGGLTGWCAVHGKGNSEYGAL